MRYPTNDEWAEVLLVATEYLKGEMQYLGVRSPHDIGDQNSYSLVARSVTDLQGRRLQLICSENMTTDFFLSEGMEWLVVEADRHFTEIKSWSWHKNDNLIDILNDERFGSYLAEKMLSGLERIVNDKIMSTRQRLKKFKKIKRGLEVIVTPATTLPDPTT